MKIDRDTLRRSYRAYMASRRPPSREKCPSPEAIARSFKPSYPAWKKRRIIDHISECSSCRGEFMMFLELQRSETLEEQAQEHKPFETRPSGRERIRTLARSPLWQYACVLIGICLAATSFVLLVQQGSTSGTRRAHDSDIMLLSPKSGQTISSSILFRWRRTSGAEYYVVELFDEQLLPVWSSDVLRNPEVFLPQQVSARLLPDRSYYWMVTGFVQESKTGESPLVRFRIVR